jgi:hypothetical protein
MSAEAAWKPDPYGRFAMRYHDGSEWTEHVVDGGGSQLVDPMGRSSVIPFALPKSATGDAGTSSGSGSGSDSPWPPPDPDARRG